MSNCNNINCVSISSVKAICFSDFYLCNGTLIGDAAGIVDKGVYKFIPSDIDLSKDVTWIDSTGNSSDRYIVRFH